MRYLIVGLGNPGRRYAATRHNVGFRAVDRLAKRLGTEVSVEKWQALVGEARFGTDQLLLAKPQTFMNLSGQSVAEIVRFYRLEPEQILVLCDDIDIAVGTIRVRAKGSPGTHNGLRSLVKELKTSEFGRIKLSVGRRPPFMDLADFVLSSFEEREKAAIEEELDAAVEATLLRIEQGYPAAMNRYNAWRAPSTPVLTEEEQRREDIAYAVQAQFRAKACGEPTSKKEKL